MEPRKVIDSHDHRPEAWHAAGFPPCPPPQEGWEPVFLRYSKPPPGGRSRNLATGLVFAGTSVFKAYRTPGSILVDLQESLPLAVVFTRASAGYRKPYLMTGEVVGYAPTGREPLLRVESFKPVPFWTKIEPTCGPLPQGFTTEVLRILEQQRRAVALARSQQQGGYPMPGYR